MIQIPLGLALKHLVETATKGWDVYDRKRSEAEIRKRIADHKQAQGELVARLEVLEDTQLEQAAVVRELSEKLKEFGEAMQAEVEAQRKRQITQWVLAGIGAGLGLTGFVVSLLAFFR